MSSSSYRKSTRANCLGVSWIRSREDKQEDKTMEIVSPEPRNAGADIRDILRRGVESQLHGDLESAYAQYERALAADPGIATVENNLAFLLAQQGRYAEAIARYERVLNREPNRGTTRSNLALARLALGDLAGALVDLQRAVELDPSNVLAWDNLG